MLLRSLNCPNCGGRARLLRGEQTAACLHCGSEVKLSQAYLEEQARARRFPTRTFVRLGMKADWQGAQYEVVGRQVFQDPEDATSTWEEWVLVSETGEVLFLEFDEGKWKLSKSFTPQQTPSPDQLRNAPPGRVVNFGDTHAMVTESGAALIVHVEGELPWLVRPGQATGYVDALRAGEFFCVEWTEDAIECYRGHFVDQRQLCTLFGQKEALIALDRQQLSHQSRRRFGAVCIAAGVLALCCWIYSFGGGQVVEGGMGNTPLAGVTDEGVRFGPVELRARDRVHRLEIQGKMSDDSNWVAAVLEDAEEQELVSADRDMWDEHGVDSDGAWHESDLSASHDFVLRKPGQYYVRLYAEPEPGRTPSLGTSGSFVLREGVLNGTWLGIYGFLALVIGTCFLLSGSPQTVQKFQESMASSDD